MLIRAAEPRDAMAVMEFVAMAESEMLHHFSGTGDVEKAKETMLRFVESAVPNRYSLSNCLVAEVDGRAAGAILCFPADDQPSLDGELIAWLNSRGRGIRELVFEGEPGTYYASTMGVDPAYRGRGIGSALLNAVAEKAKDLGYSRVSLLVSRDKPKARALYERLGFVVGPAVRIADHEYLRMIRTVGDS